MKLSSREDVDAPIAQVFDALSDFDSFARLAMRRGSEVQRVDHMAQLGEGMQWDVRFNWRGRPRDVQLTLSGYEPPCTLLVSYGARSVEGAFHLELLALSRTRTRINVGFEVKPLNLSARLLVQSLRLAKSTLSKRFKLGFAEYAKTLETRLQQVV